VIVRTDGGATVEVILADEGYAPSAVLVDGMSLWTF
jgi:hypothetical protein